MEAGNIQWDIAVHLRSQAEDRPDIVVGQHTLVEPYANQAFAFGTKRLRNTYLAADPVRPHRFAFLDCILAAAQPDIECTPAAVEGLTRRLLSYKQVEVVHSCMDPTAAETYRQHFSD